jgi:6-phosphogluconolactonase (cycloisomerase 2 family)
VPHSPFETEGDNPAWFAVNESGTRLFAVTGDGLLEVFDIAGDALTRWEASPFQVPAGLRAIAVFNSSRREWLYTGHMASPRGVRVWKVKEGKLEPAQFMSLEGICGRVGLDMALAPVRGFLYVVDLDNGIFPFAIDPGTGELDLITKVPVDLGGLCREIGLTRGEKYLYAVLPSGQQGSEILSFEVLVSGNLRFTGRDQACSTVESLQTSGGDEYLYGASGADDGICFWAILRDGTLKYGGVLPDGSGEPAPQMLWVR